MNVLADTQIYDLFPAIGRLYHYRGISAVGSASHWQCGGQGFKSPMLHQNKSLCLAENIGFIFFLLCFETVENSRFPLRFPL